MRNGYIHGSAESDGRTRQINSSLPTTQLKIQKQYTCMSLRLWIPQVRKYVTQLFRGIIVNEKCHN